MVAGAILMLLGRTEQCRRLIRTQQLLRPDMGGPEMKEKFSKLLEICEEISRNHGSGTGT